MDQPPPIIVSYTWHQGTWCDKPTQFQLKSRINTWEPSLVSNTIYKDKIRMTLLSSRNNYCVHSVVSKGPNKNHECLKITRPDQQKFGQKDFKSECGLIQKSSRLKRYQRSLV